MQHTQCLYILWWRCTRLTVYFTEIVQVSGMDYFTVAKVICQVGLINCLLS